MLALAPAGPDRAWADQAEPDLTILFTGNSQGKLQPCPTCKGVPLGGLARRQTILNRYRTTQAEKDRLLILGGAYEFLPIRVREEIPRRPQNRWQKSTH